MRSVEIHSNARETIREFSKEVRNELGSALLKMQIGMILGFPISRPMPDVYPGAYELRFRDSYGIRRVFYYLKSPRAILVFHAFTKKTQKTPLSEMSLGRKRLKEMLADEKYKHAIVIHNAAELAQALGLKAEDAVAMEFRARLNKKIVDLANSKGWTHADLAAKAGASRTRITAILNGQTQGVSTDYLLRILYALGCKTAPTFSSVRSAA